MSVYTWANERRSLSPEGRRKKEEGRRRTEVEGESFLSLIIRT
ncbi:hypothetical protein [Okeania sp. SIO2C9]|nr:hypothetical protein [Okeania sp. SIO2C9]